jgi:hypothetical protein
VRAVWASGGLALALLLGLGGYLWPLQPGVLALQLAFTPQAFGEVVHAWPPAHLQRYRQHLWVDFGLLAAYASFGWLLASRTRLFAVLGQSWRRVARAALPLAALCDAAENTLHLWLTDQPRFGLAAVYALSASAALAKWLLLIGFAILVVVALTRHPD